MTKRSVRLPAALIGAVTVAALMLSTGQAWATTFSFTSGSATITATAGANTILSDVTVPLDGAFVEFDDTGSGSLVDFLITLVDNTQLTLDSFYGGYDMVTVESADISPGPGFANLFNQSAGGGLFSFLASPVDTNGVYSATDSTATKAPSGSLPVPFTDTNSINGSVNINTGTLELTGITLTSLPALAFDETDDLIVKADLTFTGMVVPEPGTALLFGTGLLLLVGRRNH